MNGLSAKFMVSCLGLLLAGCITPQGQPDYTANGALIGGASGALIGGSVARHPGKGALIGGAAGVIAGGLIGHGMDQAQQARLQTSAPQTWKNVEQGQPLTVEDVKALSRAGVSDDLIISQINATRTVYRLGTTDIIALKNTGVSERVIDVMINTPSTAMTPPTATVVTSAPPPAIRETIVVASPGTDYVWIPGAWIWFGSRWVWSAGHWARPPHPRAHWVAGGWESSRGHRVWREGHWR